MPIASACKCEVERGGSESPGGDMQKIQLCKDEQTNCDHDRAGLASTLWGDHPLPNPPSNADNPTLTLDTDCQLSCWNPSTAGRSYGSDTYLKVPVFVRHARITPGNSFRGTALGTLTMCSSRRSSRSRQSHQGSPPLFPMYLIPVAAPSSSTWITK